jgi:hypothetical protein
MIIAVQNLSTLVSGEDAYDMTMIVDHQARAHVAPAWGIQPPVVVYLNGGAKQKYDALIGILDDADQAGVLGWHTEGPDADVYGRVFARPVLEHGGGALGGALSVCSVLSHEVIEVIGDRACNGWAQRADGVLIATELCDPVEGDSYEVTVAATDGASVSGTVSDFVFSSWFDPNARGAPYDWMDTLSAPFEVRPDGYVIAMSGGQVTELWGECYPGWRIATKEHLTSRTARRDSSVVPQEPLENNVPTSLA